MKIKRELAAELEYAHAIETRIIKVDGDGKLHPVGFLVDPHRMIKIVYYGKHFVDHIHIDELLSTVNTANYAYKSHSVTSEAC